MVRRYTCFPRSVSDLVFLNRELVGIVGPGMAFHTEGLLAVVFLASIHSFNFNKRSSTV